MYLTFKFLLFQAVIILPFVVGIIIKSRLEKPQEFTRRLIMVNLVFIEPVIVFWSIWGLNLRAEFIYLPLAGMLMVMTGLITGKAVAPVLKLNAKSRASFMISSSIANHGFTMGGFVCYLIMGERGLALSFIFLSYFIPYLFLVIFPYARLVSSGETLGLNVLRDFIKSPRNMPLYAMLAAICIRYAGFERPVMYFPIDAILMLSIGIYYLSLGISFTLKDMFMFKKESLLLSVVRFLLIPAIAVVVLYFINLDPAIEAIILIESFMPAAVFSVMSSVLFGLDGRMASTMFVFNTVMFLLFVLPMLFLFYKVLHGFIT